MKIVRLADENGRVVCPRCAVADNPWTRLRGLLGRGVLEPGEGLLIRPAGSVHTFFMRFAIDVVWLDRDLRVLDVRPNLQPWRMAGRRGARAALELAAGECERVGLRAGDRLLAA